MSAKLERQSADEWERENCDEELKAERKADKGERGRVSDTALALTSLLEAGGVSSHVFQAVHVFLGKSRYFAPDEVVRFFSERDAGALLPGDDGVSYASLRKRFVRAWGEIEAEQANTKKRFCGRREKGSIRLASRQADEKKKAPEYFSQVAQAVLDVARVAARLRGSREDRFRRAALDVWAKLPAFSEDDITIHPERPVVSKKDVASNAEPKHSRRLDRFVRAAHEMLTEAKKQDEKTVTATCKELAVELGNVFAEALDVDHESALRLLADTLIEVADAPVDSIKVRAFRENQNLQNSEQKRENDSSDVYEPVHVGPDGAGGRSGQGEVIYAEDFTV